MSLGSPSVIVVDGVSKEFRLPREQVHTLKERVVHPLRRPGFDRLEALRSVSFDVRQGEFFGIVGRNGSGKSTLLKCLAGIYGTDAGRIYVDGRVSAFIELGVGFNMDLPARDNIIINATMLGLTQREARERSDAILEFAELRDFIDLRLKNYSSGMLVRLAFSVMIQVDAEVLLIDEVLAVGDAAFQQKCFEEFARLRRANRTVVLVTHEMGSVQRFCDRAMLLEKGRLVEIGEPQPVSMRYLQLNFSQDARAAEAAADGVAPAATPSLRAATSDELRAGDGSAEVVSGWFMNAAGEQVDTLPVGERATFCLHVRFRHAATDPIFSFGLRNTEDTRIVAGHSREQLTSETFEAGEEAIVYFGFDNVLAADRYWVSAAIAHAGSGEAWMDNRERFRSIVTSSTEPSSGLVELPLHVYLQREVAAGAVSGAEGSPLSAASEEVRLTPVGREVKGPTALGDDPRRLWRLAYTLASTDFKLTFFGSFLGYLWQLINPLLLFGVLFTVFSLALSLDAGVRYFPVALLLGIVLFGFFSEATSTSVRSLVARENLVRKVDFPRLAVPIATVMTSAFNLCLNLIPVFIFLLASGATPRWSWLLLPVILGLLVLFAFGLAMLLSVAFVWFRDIEPIWSVTLQVLFYTSGVFFTFDKLLEKPDGQLFVDILLCNPFAMLLAQARHTFIDPSWQAPGAAMSTPWLLLIPYGIIAVSIGAGYLVFRRQAPKIAEDL